MLPLEHCSVLPGSSMRTVSVMCMNARVECLLVGCAGTAYFTVCLEIFNAQYVYLCLMPNTFTDKTGGN